MQRRGDSQPTPTNQDEAVTSIMGIPKIRFGQIVDNFNPLTLAGQGRQVAQQKEVLARAGRFQPDQLPDALRNHPTVNDRFDMIARERKALAKFQAQQAASPVSSEPKDWQEVFDAAPPDVFLSSNQTGKAPLNSTKDLFSE